MDFLISCHHCISADSFALLAISIRSKIGIQTWWNPGRMFAQEDHRRGQAQKWGVAAIYLSSRGRTRVHISKGVMMGDYRFLGGRLKTAAALPPGDSWIHSCTIWLLGREEREGGGRGGRSLQCHKCVKWFTDQIAADILERHIDWGYSSFLVNADWRTR